MGWGGRGWKGRMGPKAVRGRPAQPRRRRRRAPPASAVRHTSRTWGKNTQAALRCQGLNSHIDFQPCRGVLSPHSMVTPQIGGFILGGMAGLSLTEVAAIEAFLAGSKTLDGETPHWDKSNFPGELAGRWPILDELGIGRAHLRFRVSESDPSAPSISLIFGGGSIWRIDLVPSGKCEPNPPDGYRMGLPPRVCGSHFHSWHDNKDYLTENGLGSMPYRRALQPQIRRLEQLVPWFCEQVNISITADQRGFNVPLQRTLFPGPQ